MKMAKRKASLMLSMFVLIQSLVPGLVPRAQAAGLPQGGAFSLTVGKIGLPYEYQFHSDGGLAPLNWRVVGGELPPGLSLDPAGRLKGVPSAARRESYGFTVEVSDSSQPPQRAEMPCILMIQAAPLRIVANPNKLRVVTPDTGSQEIADDPGKARAATPESRNLIEGPGATITYSSPLLPPIARPITGSRKERPEGVLASPGATGPQGNPDRSQTMGGKVAPPLGGKYEEFNPAAFIRIYEDTKRGDRYLIYEPSGRDLENPKRPRLGKIVARRYDHRIENLTRTLPTQLAVDEDSTIVIEPIPEAMGEDMPLNKLLMRAVLKRKDKTDELEVQNYAEVGEDEEKMAAQRAAAFQTTKNVQSAMLNLALTVDALLKSMAERYGIQPDADQSLADALKAEARKAETADAFYRSVRELLRFYRPEISALTAFLLDDENTNLARIIGNEVFWVDIDSLKSISKQIQDDLALAFSPSGADTDEAKKNAVKDLFQRALLIREDFREPRLEINRLIGMQSAEFEETIRDFRERVRKADENKYRNIPEKTEAERELGELLKKTPPEKRLKEGSRRLLNDEGYLILQKAILVYAERRAVVALDVLKNLFTPGYVSLENADADDGNLLTLTIEARGADKNTSGAAAQYQIAIRKFGAKLQLGSTMMFLGRKGVTENDGSNLEVVNYAPSPGMNFGVTFFKRGDRMFDKVLRAFSPTIGVNVSFMNFKDPGFDQASGMFTNTTGTDVQVGVGPVLSLFNNKIDITTGWNLNVERKRRYFGFGFGFIEIAKFLKDKVKTNE